MSSFLVSKRTIEAVAGYLWREREMGIESAEQADALCQQMHLSNDWAHRIAMATSAVEDSPWGES